ncbi:hypothetical protein [Marinigracilibium pacificum]|nr:hypothetical protein [Marinigracilibium pacificum]
MIRNRVDDKQQYTVILSQPANESVTNKDDRWPHNIFIALV